MYLGHNFKFLGHVTSSVTWPFDSLRTISYRCSIGTHALSPTDFEILRLKYIGVTSLTFRGHVTSSVTSPFDSQYVISYRWSIDTDLLSWIVFVILSLKCIWVTTLTFWVTWRHRWRHHSTPNMWFPIGGPLIPSSYLLRLPRYFGVHVQYWAKHAYSRVNGHITHIAHALYHVIGLQGVKNNRIFGIPDPHLPIPYATFGALRWWLRVVYREHPHAFWSKVQKMTFFGV